MSAEKILKILKKNLLRPCPTRWNSEYDALVDLLQFEHKVLNELCDELDLDRFNEKEIIYLKEYLEVLKPIAIAIDRLQGQDKTFFGYMIPELRQTEKNLKKMIASGNFKYCKPILTVALQSLQTRFKHYLEQDLELAKDALIATVTIPEFKLLPIMKDKRDAVKKLLIEKATELSESETDSENKQTTVRDDFYDFSDDDDDEAPISVPHSNKNSVAIEVLNYLQDESTSLDTLHKYPKVKEVFLKYNTPLTSSAPVERLFSFASIINQPRRRKLGDVLFGILTILKANSRWN